MLAGARAMMPHARIPRPVSTPGEVVAIDFGAALHGDETDTCSSHARGEPAALPREPHAMVAEAFAAAVAACRRGAAGGDVHRAAADVIGRAGYGQRFTHAVAHGCAPQSHEPSRWDASSAAPPRAGRVLATEPAICFGGVGLRLEDDVAVRPGGGQSLNRAPMDLSR